MARILLFWPAMLPACPHCHAKNKSGESCPKIKRDGQFYRKSDGRWVRRFYCRRCNRGFSRATLNPCYRQKKRHKIHLIFNDLCTGVSQRNIARKVCVNRKTVARKVIFLAQQARWALSHLNQVRDPVMEFQFDDLETFEHSKCKPVSVSIAVEAGSRYILGFRVSRMPAKGRLAKRAREQDGPRPDERSQGRKELFEELKSLVHPEAIIRSDQSPHYPADVRRFFPNAKHITVKGQRGAKTGQGELKQVVFDPIFSLNHTFAMLRYGISSLIRKTWCTAKLAERLADRIAIYAYYHNLRLLAK